MLRVGEHRSVGCYFGKDRTAPFCFDSLVSESRLCASFHEVCASRAGRPAPLRSALKSRIARNFRRRKDTRYSRSENGADFHPNPASGELSPVSFEGRKPTFSRGNWTMCEEKSHIAQTLRLYGGARSERTILHRRIPVNNPNWGSNWSDLPVAGSAARMCQ